MTIADAFKSFLIATTGGVVLWQHEPQNDLYDFWSPSLDRGGTLTAVGHTRRELSSIHLFRFVRFTGSQ